MKTLLITLLACSFLTAQSAKFSDWFEDATMRIDYYHSGHANSEEIIPDRLYRYDIWAGSRENLIDQFQHGRYFYKIYDTEKGILLYSKGFDSYFGEYKTTDDAIAGKKKVYHESALIPFPRKSVVFVVEMRKKDQTLIELFKQTINPADDYIIRNEKQDQTIKIFNVQKSGAPNNKLDIVILAEGYTLNEQKKFEKDLQRFSNGFFKQEPYKSKKNLINITGVFKPSQESGCDEPGAGIFRNTALNCTFYSLGSERYLLTEDNKTMRDIASVVPYDAIYIMVNHEKYGGGGIYNLFCTFTSDNQWFEYLFLHEFGHSFAGLADEYYTSDVAYSEFYPQGIEPLEPNITAATDPAKVKWRNHFKEPVEVPTLWEKADFDSLDLNWQKERRKLNKEIASLKKNGAPKKEIDNAIKHYNLKDKEHSAVVEKFLKASKYFGKAGVYEGAGYASKGLYRPMVDCIMFSKGSKPYCGVCEEAVNLKILSYSK